MRRKHTCTDNDRGIGKSKLNGVSMHQNRHTCLSLPSKIKLAKIVKLKSILFLKERLKSQ